MELKESLMKDLEALARTYEIIQQGVAPVNQMPKISAAIDLLQTIFNAKLNELNTLEQQPEQEVSNDDGTSEETA